MAYKITDKCISVELNGGKYKYNNFIYDRTNNFKYNRTENLIKKLTNTDVKIIEVTNEIDQNKYVEYKD